MKKNNQKKHVKYMRAGHTTNKGIRLATLIHLRWLAIAGQTICLLVVAGVLRFDVPIFYGFLLIGFSILINVFSQTKFDSAYRVSNLQATFLLGIDVAQLAGLLYLTGGLQNPFSIMLLAPVAVSASTLAQRHTIFLGMFVMVIAGILGFMHLPLPWFAGEMLLLDPLYIVGIWIALVSGAVFIAAYTERVASEARHLAQALNATEIAMTREQHLHQLDGLAAAAAHELGTPLATITLTVNELEAELKDLIQQDPNRNFGLLTEDIALIKEQAARCRSILGRLQELNTDQADPFPHSTLKHLLEEIIQPHQSDDCDIVIDINQNLNGSSSLIVGRQPSLLHGLGNLVENAVRHAHSSVLITAEISEILSITIEDDGSGYRPDILPYLGEPYLGGVPSTIDPEGGKGLGLGIFIAKTLLERTSARLEFSNKDDLKGAQVRIKWDRDALENLRHKA